jgi:endonuclease G
MRFWKIAVWNDGSMLRSIALIADQRPVLQVMPERLAAGEEAFDDEEELARVSEFLTTVDEVEAATGLDFGEAVRSGDLRAGGLEHIPALTLDPSALRKPASTTKATATARNRGKERAKSRR